MRRDQFLQLLDHGAAAHFGAVAMDQHRQGVDRLGIDEDRHLDEVARAIIGDRIIEARVALGDRLQPVIEVEHDFVERQFVDHHGALADIIEIDLNAAPVLAEFQDRAEIIVRGKDRRPDPGLLDLGDLDDIGHVGRIVQLDVRLVVISIL